MNLRVALLPPSTRVDPRARATRVVSVDMVRAAALVLGGVALFGTLGGLPATVATGIGAVATVVFALVCGMSLVLGTRHLVRTRGKRGVITWGVVRGLLLAMLGIVVGVLFGDGSFVLTVFGLGLVVAAVFACAPAPVAAVAAAVALIADAEIAPRFAADGAGVAGQIGDLLLFGSPSVLSLLGPMLVGIAFARALAPGQRDCRPGSVARALLSVGGVGTAVVLALALTGVMRNPILSWSHLGGLAVAALLVGASSLLWDRAPAGRGGSAILLLQALGSAPVTVCVLSIAIGAAPLSASAGVLALIAATVVLTIVLVMWRVRGPIEAGIAALTRLAVTALVPFDFALASRPQRTPALSR